MLEINWKYYIRGTGNKASNKKKGTTLLLKYGLQKLSLWENEMYIIKISSCNNIKRENLILNMG